MFSWEICEIFKNTYFEEHLRTTASNDSQKRMQNGKSIENDELTKEFYETFWNHINHKKAETGVNLNPLWFFPKCIFQRKREALVFCENSKEVVNFVSVASSRGPELNWNKFTISCEFGPLQVK